MTALPIVRTRFAPSPSGHLHVGGARTALFCWAYAKKHGGKFVLRIEDTDAKRSSDAASMAFLEDLTWLGITWDEGPEYKITDAAAGTGVSPVQIGGGEYRPYFQSQRLDIYNTYFDQLIREGKAYRAFETPEEIDAARREAQKQKKNYRYDRAALNLSPSQIDLYLREGRPYVVRFKIPDELERVQFRDEVRGEMSIERAELDDFVIRKADGFPMYNFAVVIDDELMGITHVIRAQEHLSNTFRQVLLQDALGWGGRRPTYAHISLITNPDGSKMSKRDKDKVLRATVKQRGITEPPQDATVAGQSPGTGAQGTGIAQNSQSQEGSNTSVPGIDSVIKPDIWHWWLSDKDHQLPLDDAEKLAAALQVDLPEINVDDFRSHGYLPEVMINYLALLGWSPGGDMEKFDRDFLIERFDFDRVVKTPAKFDREKLLAFNLDALQKLSDEQFAARWREHCEAYHPEFISKLTEEQFTMLARANHARSKTLEDPIRSSRFFVMGDDEIVYEQSKPVHDALLGGVGGGIGGMGGGVSPVHAQTGYDHLAALIPILRDVHDWTVAEIESAVKRYAETHAGGKAGLGKVAQPLRIAVSGGVVSPAIFDTLAILGKDSTLKRIERCLAHRATLSV
jgi:glutamyl/glutaminyl-tRNA synthetase